MGSKNWVILGCSPHLYANYLLLSLITHITWVNVEELNWIALFSHTL